MGECMSKCVGFALHNDHRNDQESESCPNISFLEPLTNDKCHATSEIIQSDQIPHLNNEDVHAREMAMEGKTPGLFARQDNMRSNLLTWTSTDVGMTFKKFRRDGKQRAFGFHIFVPLLCTVSAFCIVGHANMNVAHSKRGRKTDPVELESYIVRANESLQGIAKERDTTVLRLLDLNPRVTSGIGIQPGTFLVVPKLPEPPALDI